MITEEQKQKLADLRRYHDIARNSECTIEFDKQAAYDDYREYYTSLGIDYMEAEALAWEVISKEMGL